MNDAGTRFPESHIVLDAGPRQGWSHVDIHMAEDYLCGRSTQEVVNLPVNVNGALEIGDTTNLSLDQVVAVNGGWDGSPIHSGRHELQDSHLDEQMVRCAPNSKKIGQAYLRSGVLAGNSLEYEE